MKALAFSILVHSNSRFCLVLGNRWIWGPVFHALLEPRMVLPAKFHWNQWSHFPCKSGRRILWTT